MASLVKTDTISSTTASSPTVTLPTPTAPASWYVGRNILINGAMQIAQRATSVASANATPAYCVDRFRCFVRGAGAATWTQTTTVPSGEGFGNSFRWDVTTVDSSLASNDLYMIDQNIEGQDLQQLAKGTSDAKQLTLSFWVRSTKTGTYIIQLVDEDNSRHICQAYTISVADTWEYKTLTFAGDTTGALGNDNGGSLRARWYLAAGTDYTSGTLATTWAAQVTANRAVGQVNFFDSTSNDFYLTGVQLEVGSAATPFEHNTYGQELQDCERYYQTYGRGFHAFGISGTTIDSQFSFRQIMRASPSVTLLDTTPKFSQLNVAARTGTSSSITTSSLAPDGAGLVRVDGFSSVGSNSVCIGDQSTPIFGFDAEL